MISIHTMALQEDPPAVSLPAAALSEYAGPYRSGAVVTYWISLKGDELTGGIGNNPAVAMKVEFRDVLFTPGQPRLCKIFQRDANGRITGFVSRREGHDRLIQRVS